MESKTAEALKMNLKTVEQLSIMEIPAGYVIFKPLKDVNLCEEEPVVVVFPVTPHQLSGLIVLANYV